MNQQQEQPTCPVCGMPLRQTRRGATFVKRGPAWVCPEAEREWKEKLPREQWAHPYTRVYEGDSWREVYGCAKPINLGELPF